MIKHKSDPNGIDEDQYYFVCDYVNCQYETDEHNYSTDILDIYDDERNHLDDYHDGE